MQIMSLIFLQILKNIHFLLEQYESSLLNLSVALVKSSEIDWFTQAYHRYKLCCFVTVRKHEVIQELS